MNVPPPPHPETPLAIPLLFKTPPYDRLGRRDI